MVLVALGSGNNPRTGRVSSVRVILDLDLLISVMTERMVTHLKWCLTGLLTESGRVMEKKN